MGITRGRGILIMVSFGGHDLHGVMYDETCAPIATMQ